MSEINVDTYKLRKYAERLTTVNTRLLRLDKSLKGLYSKVGLVGLVRLIQADLATHYSPYLRRSSEFLLQTAMDFESAENMLNKLDPLNFTPAFAILPEMMQTKKGSWDKLKIGNQSVLRNALSAAGTFGYGMAESALSLLTGDAWKKFWSGDLDYTTRYPMWTMPGSDDDNYYDLFSGKDSVSLTPEYVKYKNKSILGDEKHKNKNIKQKQIKGKQINEDEKFYEDPKATLFEAKVEKKLEGSVIDTHLSGKAEFAQGSVDAKVLTGSIYANAAAGLYEYTKDKDGNTKRIFSPGVSAEVGMSAAAFTYEADGRIGLGKDNNMLGMYGNVDAELLSGEAKAKFAVNRHEVFAGASAEANVAKVSATGGVSVLGTDVGVSGSLKLGVGAHANVGFTDGKFKLDVGAAVGVGFDLGVEVDIGGTVDAVCDVAQSAWNGVTDTFSKAGDFISGLWNGWN